MNKEINEHINKLADLEFEYNLLKNNCEDETQIIASQLRYTKELNKVEKMIDDLLTKKNKKQFKKGN